MKHLATPTVDAIPIVRLREDTDLQAAGTGANVIDHASYKWLACDTVLRVSSPLRLDSFILRSGHTAGSQKGLPALRGFWIPGCSSHPTGNGGLRHLETEDKEFTVNAGCTPTWILHK